MSDPRLWLAEASTAAPAVDHLFFVLLAVSAFFIVGIGATILVFCLRYRRVEGKPRQLPSRRWTALIETTWIVLPLGLCLVLFVWGANVYVEGATAPPDAGDVFVVAKQWMWKVQHPGGQREIDELHVPLGKAVRLVMTSQDVIHSFFVPAFRLKMDVLPGRYTFAWFKPTELGTFHLFCTQYCGTEHASMRGQVIVMQPAAYARWLAAQSQPESPEALGARLFADHGCIACHRSEDATRAPALEGVYGSEVLLDSGQTVVADEAYIRESIVAPEAKLVAGYKPIMPTYRGTFSEDELIALVTYIKALSQTQSQPGGNGLLDGETP